MKAIIVILLLIALFSPKENKSGSKAAHKGNRRSRKVKKQPRPWYDISYDDMIMYDLFDDE